MHIQLLGLWAKRNLWFQSFFAVFTLIYVLYFEEFLIHNLRGFMILKNN